MKPTRIGRYTYDEVVQLIAGYEELTGLRHKAWIQVRLLDLEVSLRHITRPHAGAIVLYGIIGLPLREVADLEGVSKDTIHRRFRRGIEDLLAHLNR